MIRNDSIRDKIVVALSVENYMCDISTVLNGMMNMCEDSPIVTNYM